MGAFLQDVRYAIRSLLAAPGFTAAAVVSLALGIGANSSIFTLLDAAFLRALPVERPEELVRVATRTTDGGLHGDFSYPLYAALRDGQGLAGLAAYAERSIGLSAGDRTERIGGEYVSTNYFSVLGLSLAGGSGFGPDDDRAGAAPVAVIGHGLSRRLFGDARDVVGRTILLNGRSFTVIGVVPAAFRGLIRGFLTDVWIPLSEYRSASRPVDTGPLLSDPHSSWLSLVGRLPADLSLEQGEARLSQTLRGFEPADPGIAGMELTPAAAGDDSMIAELGRPLWLLFGAVGLVLAIACANVANLLLVRGQSRLREIGVRAALGASRGRLLVQHMTESLVLSLAGGALGILLAWWTADAASTIRTTRGALRIESAVNGRVLAFTFGLSVASALVFGLIPALRALRIDLVQVLKDGPTSTRHRRRRPPLRDLLVVAQVTLCLVLLVGAGLFLRTLWNLRAIDAGFSGDDVLAVSLNLQLEGYDEARGRQFYERALERVTGLPGVRSASLATALPVSAGGTRLERPGNLFDPPVDGSVAIDIVGVGPRFFEALGLPLLGGRDFRASDRRDAPRVTVVNQTMARRFWPDGDAVGRSFFDGDVRHEVIGVARDTKYRDLREPPRLTMYLPLAQDYAPRADLFVRVAGPPAAVLPVMRRELGTIEPALAVFNARTLREHVSRSLSVERMQGVVLSAFGALALVLAGVGIYGVMAFRVAQRTREIGVRMALGAGRRELLLLVLRHALGLAVVGIVAGAVLAFWLSRGVASRLYGVAQDDPLTFVVAAGVLLGVAVVAAVLPARRASRIDPLAALRCE